MILREVLFIAMLGLFGGLLGVPFGYAFVAVMNALEWMK